MRRGSGCGITRHLPHPDGERQQVRRRRRLALGCVAGRDNHGEELVERCGREDLNDLVTKRSGCNCNRNRRGSAADERRGTLKQDLAAGDERLQLHSLPSDELGDMTGSPCQRSIARQRLEHANIVRTHDIDQDGSLHFIVMEYVDGSNLLDVVKKFGPLDIGRAVHYTRQVAEGLDYAFRNGIIHRDVKPGNVLIDRTGTAKVLDLGLARFYRDQTDMLTVKYDDKIVLGGNEIEGVLVRALRIHELSPEPRKPLKDLLAEVLKEVRPSAHARKLEYMDLVAVKECTDVQFLPPRYRDLTPEQVEAQIDALRRFI